MEELRTKLLPERQAEIRSISGNNELTYVIDWTSLDNQDAVNFFNNNCLMRVSMALRGLCIDSIGKDSLSQLREIHVQNIKMGDNKVAVDGNRISIQGHYTSSLSDCPSDRVIEAVLDSVLRITYKRMLQRVLKEQIPAREKEIFDVMGSNISLEPVLSSFDTTGSLEFLDNVAFLRLLMALRTAAAEPTSKQIVKDNLKRVVVTNVKDDSKHDVRFANGQLDLVCIFDRASGGGGSTKLLHHDHIFETLAKNLSVRASQKQTELKEQLIPGRQKELVDVFSTPVSYDVVYGSFSTDEELNYVDNVCCHRVSMACRSLDNKTKPKIVHWLRTVRIVCVKDDKEKAIRIDGPAGVLELRCALAHGLSGAFSDNAILKALKEHAASMK